MLARTWYHSMQHRVCVQGTHVTSGLLRTKKSRPMVHCYAQPLWIPHLLDKCRDEIL